MLLWTPLACLSCIVLISDHYHMVQKNFTFSKVLSARLSFLKMDSEMILMADYHKFGLVSKINVTGFLYREI